MKMDDDGSWRRYEAQHSMVFHAFAGYVPWTQEVGVHIPLDEMRRFLEIVGIECDAEEVMECMDADIEDGRLSLDEWMDYFTNSSCNPRCAEIKEHIEGQMTWKLLVQALEGVNVHRSDELKYSQFAALGPCIGLNEREMGILWKIIDENDSGAIDVTKVLEWLRVRVHRQREGIL